jgi:hypothetical protein
MYYLPPRCVCLDLYQHALLVGRGNTRERYTAETVPGDSDEVCSLYQPLNRDLRMYTYGDDVLKKAILDAWRQAVRLWQCSVDW